MGKNLESLAIDNDDHHHDIVPNLHYSADCVIFFHTDTDEQIKTLEDTYSTYIEDNKELIESTGYNVNSSKLTTGRIEIARLESNMTEDEVLTKIKKFDNIQSLFLS